MLDIYEQMAFLVDYQNMLRLLTKFSFGKYKLFFKLISDLILNTTKSTQLPDVESDLDIILDEWFGLFILKKPLPDDWLWIDVFLQNRNINPYWLDYIVLRFCLKIYVLSVSNYIYNFDSFSNEYQPKIEYQAFILKARFNEFFDNSKFEQIGSLIMDLQNYVFSFYEQIYSTTNSLP